MSAVLTGFAGVVDAQVAMGAQAHAESAADAVAHGTAAFLLRSDGHEQLSIAVQAGNPCDTDTDHSAAGWPCGLAIQAAHVLVEQNGAVLGRLMVTPDPRDMRDGRDAGRLLVQAHVFVARKLPVHPGTCPSQPGSGSDLCWADAWSAAQGAG